MKRAAVTFAVLGLSAIFAGNAAAGDGDRSHRSFHRDLEHRDFHRQLYHREAHRYPMSWRQHDRLHDRLDHDRFHDRLEHRAFHDSYRYYRPSYYHGYYPSHSHFGLQIGGLAIELCR